MIKIYNAGRASPGRGPAGCRGDMPNPRDLKTPALETKPRAADSFLDKTTGILLLNFQICIRVYIYIYIMYMYMYI